MLGVIRTLCLGAAALGCSALLVACTESPQAPEPPPVEVTVYFLECIVTPDWVAFQDGDGEWQSAAGADGLYSFVTTSDRVGTAVARTVGGRRFVFVEFTARQELTAGPDASCAEKRALPVDASGLDDHHRVVASLGGKLAHFPATQLEPIEVEVDSGPLDIIASRFLGFGTDQVDRMLLLRNHDAGAALTLDFAGEESFQPVPIDVTIRTSARRSVEQWRSTIWTSQARPTFKSPVLRPTQLRRLPGVPRDLQANGDLHAVRVIATDATSARGSPGVPPRGSTGDGPTWPAAHPTDHLRGGGTPDFPSGSSIGRSARIRESVDRYMVQHGKPSTHDSGEYECRLPQRRTC